MPVQTHRHAAIIFTDIVGYTALMGSDEQKAMQVLRKNRKTHQSIIKKYHGKWLKEMGDGILASFAKVSDAMYCAIEIFNSKVQLFFLTYLAKIINPNLTLKP